MSTIGLLERRSLPELDPADLMTDDLLGYVHEKLGYHHPKAQHLCKEGSLAKALRVAGITPFSHDSVRAYKKEQTVNFQGRVRWWSILLVRIAGISLACGFAAIIAHNSGNAAVVAILSGVIGYTAAVTLCASFFGFMILSFNGKEAKWRLVPLKEYQSPVPAFALATAKEIHQRVPGAVFSIDEMIVENVQHDPFLVVSGDGEQYYVEIWNEPGYEQPRKA